jgi:hypothetical protein
MNWQDLVIIVGAVVVAIVVTYVVVKRVRGS